MSAGRLRHPVDIEAFTSTQNPVTGAITHTWALVSREWASIEGVNGREFLAASADQAATTWRITIRYRADLTPVMRIRDGTRLFDIKAMLPNNERTQLVLMCETGLQS